MLALDAKTIKEEIPDKDLLYESPNARRLKGKDHQCRTSESPENTRIVVQPPKSPISPNHHNSNSLIPPRSSRNGSLSPNINGTSSSSSPPPPQPPPTTTTTPITISQTSASTSLSSSSSSSSSSALHSTAITPPMLHQDTSRALSQVKRYLAGMVQFGQKKNPEMADRVRALILSLASGRLQTDEFIIPLQEAINYPLKPNVLHFLKTHTQLLQREVKNLARVTNQSPAHYVRSHENIVLEFVHIPTEHTDIFLPLDGGSNILNSTSSSTTSSSLNGNGINGGGGGHSTINGNGIILKRRGSDNYYDNQNNNNNNNNGPINDWPEYLVPIKRPHILLSSSGHQIYSSNHPSLYDYQSGHHQVVPPPPPPPPPPLPPTTSSSSLSSSSSSLAASSLHSESFSSLLDKSNIHRGGDERDIRILTADGHRGISTIGGSLSGSINNNNNNSMNLITSNNNNNNNNNNNLNGLNRIGGGNEEEWKIIHTMLNCISGMVDKTKHAINILQQRGIENATAAANNLIGTSSMHGGGGGGGGGSSASAAGYADASIADIKRQTEEKVAEFRRNAEEAVNQVKRQAVMEIQRAVAAAENRAVEIMAQDRIKMEKIFTEMLKNNVDDGGGGGGGVGGGGIENQSHGSQNSCWNCSRKANETCSGCNLARYCGSFCQHKDWEQHHLICGSARNESNGIKNPPLPRTHRPPTRTSPSLHHPSPSQQQQQQQHQQQSQSQSTSGNVSNGFPPSSAGGGGGGSNNK